MEGMGLTLGMKTSLDLKITREVALDGAGLRPGGPRRQLADYAYSRLSAGAHQDTVEREVQARCLRMDRQALLDDKPTFGEQDAGAGKELCSDLALSVTGFLINEPGMMSASSTVAFERYSSSRPHGDNMQRPNLLRALELAQIRGRVDPDEMRLQQLLLDHCKSLSPAQRAALDSEFYFE
jgi:hypothetical protein